MRLLLGLLLTVALVYAGALLALYLLQRQLMYERDATRADPAAAGLARLEEAEVTTDDGERLVVWSVPPRDGRPVFLFFPGNLGNYDRPIRLERLRALVADGSGLFAVSYRGYGGSTGRPTEAGLHADARAAYGEAARRYGAGRLVAYGESLGSGVVVRLARDHRLMAAVLEAPYLSTAALAALRYPFVPVRLLMHDQFRSDEIIAALGVPLLFLHGAGDDITPLAQGRALFERATAPRRFVAFAAGGHEDLPRHGSIAELRAFLDDVAAGRLAGAETRVVE